MLPEFGQIALILALLASFWQAAGPLLFPPFLHHSAFRSIRRTAYAQTLFILCAFLILVLSFAASDFTLQLTYAHSHTQIPLLYKITGAWGNHEGSMLLWVTVLGIFSSLLAFHSSPPLGERLGRRACGEEDWPLGQAFISPQQNAANAVSPHPNLLPHWGRRNICHTALQILGAMQFGLLVFILMTSNPFLRMFPPASEGEDLNPLLQDIGLAIHPPMLYLGYVGFGVAFAIAIAALLHNRADKEIAKLLHPWILVPWSFLTFGIALGSWWAYRELGWGGFWFWDPVENASLLPWLAGTALLHSNIVLEKRGKTGRWVMLLAILTFTFSLIGTFLVRSGVVTSVHSFASDPTRGVFILGYIAVIAGGGLFLFARKAAVITPAEPIHVVSREGAIVVNNLFLIVAALSILLATVYPMLIPLWNGQPISIGAPYYNQTVLPLMLPMLILAGLSGFLTWVDTPLKKTLLTVRHDLIAACTGALIVGFITHTYATWLLIGVTIGLWLLFTTFHYGIKLHRAQALGKPHYGMLASHAGVSVFVLVIAFYSAFKTEHELVLSRGESKSAGPYRIEFSRYGMEKQYTYVSAQGTFRLWQGDREITTLTPEERIYMLRGSVTYESAIDTSFLRDLYLAMRLPFESGRQEKADSVIVTLYSNPLMLPLWLSLLMIGAGGLLALRRT